MLNIEWIKKSPEAVKADLTKRLQKEKIPLVDSLVKIYDDLRKLKKELDTIRHNQNLINQRINKLKKEGNSADKNIKEAKEVSKKEKKFSQKTKELELKIKEGLRELPNILDKEVPLGKSDEDNVEIRKYGAPKKFDFELKVHGELLEERGLADFKKAASVAGSGFYYLKGKLALLDQALVRFAIDNLVKKGFNLVIPPYMLNKETYKEVTDLKDFESVMYKIENENLYLIATSEHPLIALYKDEIINQKDLPIKLLGLSQNFRKEIGSHGVDTRGLFRVHQFNKVEQIVFCEPKQSNKVHQELIKNAEELFQALELPYRVVNVCTGDIGVVASKKYDLEVWMPRENTYKEAVSCSNCTDYQSFGLNIKYMKTDNTKEHVHTLNSTAIATSRALRAIIENFQDKDGKITIPKALIPYTGFDVI